MASKLATLIRLHRWRIDEARRQLASFEQEAVNYEESIASLDANLLAETSRQADDVTVRSSQYGFIVQSLTERERLSTALGAVKSEIDACRDALKELIWERRRLELRVEQMKKDEQQLARQKENNVLDDQANIRFISKRASHI